MKKDLSYDSLLDKDITVFTEYGSRHRGTLRVIHTNEELLEFEVGVDTLFVNPKTIYAVTVHGV